MLAEKLIVYLSQNKGPMRFLSILWIFTSSILIGQEELLNQCFVLTLDVTESSDLRKATFDLPFAAMRATPENKKKSIPHYFFDITTPADLTDGIEDALSVVSIRTYVYGETLAANEISFFVMEWPEEMRPTGSGPVLASFPSINDHDVHTKNLHFAERLELPDLLVKQLSLDKKYIEIGRYTLYAHDVVF